MYIMMCTQRDFACSIHEYTTGGTGAVAADHIYIYLILCTREASRRLYCIIIIIVIVQAAARPESEKRKKTTLPNRIYETTWGRASAVPWLYVFGMG